MNGVDSGWLLAGGATRFGGCNEDGAMPVQRRCVDEGAAAAKKASRMRGGPEKKYQMWSCK